jgi:hypothetical protein
MFRKYRAVRYPPDETERSRRWLLIFFLVICAVLLALVVWAAAQSGCTTCA